MENQTPQITFSYNWNLKLSCNVFSTIRIENPNRYIVGKEYEILLKGTFQFKASIVLIKPFRLQDLTEYVAMLDTGYSLEKCRDIILKMYPKVDFNKVKLWLILLKTA